MARDYQTMQGIIYDGSFLDKETFIAQFKKDFTDPSGEINISKLQDMKSDLASIMQMMTKGTHEVVHKGHGRMAGSGPVAVVEIKERLDDEQLVLNRWQEFQLKYLSGNKDNSKILPDIVAAMNMQITSSAKNGTHGTYELGTTTYEQAVTPAGLEISKDKLQEIEFAILDSQKNQIAQLINEHFLSMLHSVYYESMSAEQETYWYLRYIYLMSRQQKMNNQAYASLAGMPVLTTDNKIKYPRGTFFYFYIKNNQQIDPHAKYRYYKLFARNLQSAKRGSVRGQIFEAFMAHVYGFHRGLWDSNELVRLTSISVLEEEGEAGYIDLLWSAATNNRSFHTGGDIIFATKNGPIHINLQIKTAEYNWQVYQMAFGKIESLYYKLKELLANANANLTDVASHIYQNLQTEAMYLEPQIEDITMNELIQEQLLSKISTTKRISKQNYQQMIDELMQSERLSIEERIQILDKSGKRQTTLLRNRNKSNKNLKKLPIKTDEQNIELNIKTNI